MHPCLTPPVCKPVARGDAPETLKKTQMIFCGLHCFAYRQLRLAHLDSVAPPPPAPPTPSTSRPPLLSTGSWWVGPSRTGPDTPPRNAVQRRHECPALSTDLHCPVSPQAAVWGSAVALSVRTVCVSGGRRCPQHQQSEAEATARARRALVLQACVGETGMGTPASSGQRLPRGAPWMGWSRWAGGGGGGAPSIRLGAAERPPSTARRPRRAVPFNSGP